MSYKNIREEELKNKIAKKYFGVFDSTKIFGDIDFCVTLPVRQDPLSETVSLFWAEAKKGKSDVYKSIVQLILTIGKARTFDKQLPPAFLGAFDYEKIAFIAYNEIQEIFYLNDFNWNIRPSNHNTKEFKIVYDKVKKIIEDNYLLFVFDNDEKELRKFVDLNFIAGKSNLSKIRIDKNNFLVIYNKWLLTVKPKIIVNWKIAKKNGIIDGDFYLADLLSSDNKTLKDKLYVLLKKDYYQLDRKIDDMGMFITRRTYFSDKQKSHKQFWNKYERPPKEQYWDYIVKRRDLLVPQDVRERKGSFFTPKIWVELSQKYITDVLGEDWQDEYYVWDCAAGTGNLLTGLTNKYNIWASTLDQQDVDVMKDRIDNGANLLESHVFRFDFLNDDFSKLPETLQKIINNPEKRKKLVVYINPPYAEAGSVTVTDKKKNKTNVATNNIIWNKYKDKLGLAIRELFSQFFIRIHQEIPNCKLAGFSTLKYINSDGFNRFRELFTASYTSGFIVPANTFDNVRGSFPIGFLIWNLNSNANFNKIETKIYDKNKNCIGSKKFYAVNKNKRITQWIKQLLVKNKSEVIAYTGNNGPDFQNNIYLHISSHHKINKNGTPNNATKYSISKKNIIPICVYFSVRHCIKATWLNDRDQFLYPNDKWKKDKIFQNDCLTFTLFHGQNRIMSEFGTNHWIPFSEYEVDAQEKFESNFMTKFINGKIKIEQKADFLNSSKKTISKKLKFSLEAKAVFNAGKELWKYYHTQPNCNANASLYDIREHFQGRNTKGRMNNKSKDEKYTKLITILREKLKKLAKKIEPKVYKYGFLNNTFAQNSFFSLFLF